MRIAQLAPVVERVPPHMYGGTELVVNLLTEELVRRGHEVTLFASGDSSTAARLVSTVERALRLSNIKMHLGRADEVQALSMLQDLHREFYIIHNHMGWQALPYLHQFDVPTISTNHNIIESAVAPI